MSVLISDIQNDVNDLLQNYTTGTIDLGNRIRAINRAYEWVQTKLTLPSDKKIYRFYFSQDTIYYTAPSDFNEPLLLIYDNIKYNKPGYNWEYRQDTDIMERSGVQYSGKKWSTTTVNGLMQIMLLGANLNQGSTITTFDAITGITASGDANTPAIDTIVKYEGSGSLKFNITPNTGTASIKWIPTVVDWRAWHTNNAWFKMRLYMPSVAFSAINLKVGSDASNYYTFTATTKDDGTAFTTNNWNLVSWKFSDNPPQTGSPNDAAISFVQIDFVLSGFGVSTVSNFRIDDFYATIPDYMDLVYLSNNKGTTSGGVALQNFTVGTDIPAFSTIAPDLRNPIAYRAAYILHPQLRKEPEFWSMYKTDCEEIVRTYGKIYPRQRLVNFGKLHLNRD